jgi:N-acetylneuraminate synthase
MAEFRIEKHIIDDGSNKPYIIAEVGVNYEGSMQIAKEMIREAKRAGADAVKFQSYKAQTLASIYSPAYWDITKEPTYSQYELFRKNDTFWEKEYYELADFSQKIGITFMSTPFDIESVDFLEDLMPVYKVASADITNIPFLKYIAQKNKPMLLATGASNVSEVEYAINEIRKQGNNQIALMHCVLSYPTKNQDANLNIIKYMKSIWYDYIIGYSDHTLPDKNMIILTTAFLFGAKIIEKHFTLNKNLKGNDHYHAMDSEDLRRFIENINILAEIKGQYKKGVLDCEKMSRKYARRSLVATQRIKKGEVITEEMITWKRPGTGIEPKDINKVIGLRASVDIKEDEILNWTMFK